MEVKDDELYDFVADFGKRNMNVTRERLLAVLKGRFYQREDARQLLYRCEHLGLIWREEESITIRFIRK